MSRSEKATVTRHRRSGLSRCLPLMLLIVLFARLTGLSRAESRVVAVDEGAGQILFFDGDDFHFLSATPVGNEPRQPAVAQNLQRLYVPNRDSNNVTVVDWTNGNVVTTINHASFNQPISAAANLNESEVWVLNRQGGSGDGSISIISTASNSVIGTLALASFSDPVSIAYHRTRRLFHVVNNGNQTLTVVNSVTRMQRAVVNVGADPVQAAIAEAKDVVFVANHAAGSLTRINTANFTTSSVLVSGSPRGLAILGDYVFVTREDQSLSRVAIQSVATSQITPFGVGFSSYGLSTLAGTNLLLVGDRTNDQIHAVNADLGTEYTASPFPLTGFNQLGAIISVGQNNLADLSIVKDDLADPTRAGQLLDYTLKVKNAGPGTATDILIEDLLPNNVTFQGASLPGGQCLLNVQTVECRLASLTLGGEVTATVQIIPQGQGTILNQSQVSSQQDDPDETDNDSTETTQILASADLQVLLSADPLSAPVGSTVEFDILVRNLGPSRADQVTLTFRPPRNSVLVDSQTKPANCVMDNSVAICNLASMARLAEFPLSFRISPLMPGRFQASAQVNSQTYEPNSANNSKLVFIDVSPSDFVSDLTISKTSFSSSFSVGEEAQFGIIVRNFGPDTNQLVRWIDQLPDGVSLVSVSPGLGCSLSDGQVVCELGAVPVGENLHFVLTLRAEANAYGELTNHVRVEGLGQDPDDSNNQSFSTILVAGTGDFNMDGLVNAADLQELILELNDGDGEDVADVAGGSHAGTPQMDLNHDGLVNQQDLEIMGRLLFK